MAVDAEAGSEGYGKIRVLKLPTSTTAAGPKQVQSQFNSEQDIAESIRLLRGGDSEVEYGNLLAVPLDGGLLYVEPVYVRGGGLKYPLLRKVLVTYGGQTAFEDTLEQALDKVFGTEASATEPPPGRDEGTQPPPKSDNPSVQEALNDAQDAFQAGQEALQKNDWEAYGQAQKDLEAALRKAEEAQSGDGGGGGGSGASDSSPSPAPSPSS
ncbi:hypothetical protein SHIRM173S_03032 [Streptomyces hirsutus]